MCSRETKQTQARRHGLHDLSHPIPIGETVTVFRISPVGISAEGTAVIRSRASRSHQYYVAFGSDPTARLRSVLPDYRRHTQLLQILREIWRASNTPAIDEFHPEESN